MQEEEKEKYKTAKGDKRHLKVCREIWILIPTLSFPYWELSFYIIFPYWLCHLGQEWVFVLQKKWDIKLGDKERNIKAIYILISKIIS